jgi:hypothetical protein
MLTHRQLMSDDFGETSAFARLGVPDRGEHRQAAPRAAADIEGHSEVAKFSQRDD